MLSPGVVADGEKYVAVNSAQRVVGTSQCGAGQRMIRFISSGLASCFRTVNAAMVSFVSGFGSGRGDGGGWNDACRVVG